MVQINLKRKYENNSCTHGILTIPAYGFKCLTLELRNGDNRAYKLDCRISEGSYILVRGYAQGWPSFPVFWKKPQGFAKKPEFNLSADRYMNLPTGDIALGTEMLDSFSIRPSDELATAFKDIFQDVFARKETVVLCVYKSMTFRHEDVTYNQFQDKVYNFIKNDE
jgi:hypothetical protein